jgi:hypothetical protein
VLALVFALDFVRNLNHSIFLHGVRQVYADAAMFLGIEASLLLLYYH